MEEGEIFLKAKEFNEWMRVMEEGITKARDELSLLETETGRLSKIWEGSAKEVWERELGRILEQAGKCLADMEALMNKTWEKARALVQMEKIMTEAAKAL